MPLRPTNQKSFTTQSGRDLPKAVRASLYDQESRGRTPLARSMLSAQSQRGNADGDTSVRLESTGGMTLSVFDAKGGAANLTIPADISTQLAYQEGSGAPTVANFPDDGDWGEYYDTSANVLYLVRNRQGSLIFLNFVSISGTISDAQHGDRSTTTTTMHKFAQISGSITAAQHGDFTAASANDALHAIATTAHPGFLSTTFFDLLNGATSAATASALVRRNASGGANFAGSLVAVDVDASGHYEVDSVQVVSNRNTGWTAPTATQSKAGFGNGATATQIEQNLSAVINALITHGLLGA